MVRRSGRTRRRARGRARWITAAVAVAAGLTTAAPATGAVRIGAEMNAPVDTAGAEGCEALVLPPLRPTYGVPPSCTLMSPGWPGGPSWQAPRGRWVVVTARVRTGPRTGPMVFTVVRALRSQAGGGAGAAGAICCTAPVESQAFTPAPSTVTTVPVRLPVVNVVERIDGEPVEVVDYLGISPLTLGSTLPLHAGSGGAGTTSFAPAMRAGGQQVMGPTLAGFPVIDAVLEPDADGDGFGDETQDACPGDATRRAAPAGARAVGPPRVASPRQACAPVGGGGGTGGAAGPGGGGGSTSDVPRPLPVVKLGAPRQTVAQVRRRGVLRVTCASTPVGRCSARATVTRAQARRLRLRVRGERRTVQVGRGSVRTTRAGSGRTIKVRLKQSARRAIGRSRRTVRVRVRVTVGAPGHRSRVVTRTVRVRR
ncbi:MAG: hypothetical protein M0P31_06760 [Solirubrobacteraceae bacterium]|nr:hypothetical protein [Solirubrobacteraceae bacterium]